LLRGTASSNSRRTGPFSESDFRIINLGASQRQFCRRFAAKLRRKYVCDYKISKTEEEEENGYRAMQAARSHQTLA
jgi:hypothetical protein